MKVLIIGGSGLVGSKVLDLLNSEGTNLVLSPSSKELNILNKELVNQYFEENNDSFDVVINFAAYTDVAKAEEQRGDKQGLAWALNVGGLENILKASKKYNKHLIHISTGFVFPGTPDFPGPYSEDAPLLKESEYKKLGWYAITKLEAEKLIKKEAYPKVSVIRIPYPVRAHFSGKGDLFRTVLNLYDSNKLYPMFADQQISILVIDELVTPIKAIVQKPAYGTFHACSYDTTTPYDFATYVLEKARGVNGVVKKGYLKEFMQKSGVKKPLFGGLSTKKTEEVLNIKYPSWKESINLLLSQV